MAEMLAQQTSLLASQLSVYLPPERAQPLAQLLATLRAGFIDPTVAQERLANDGPLLEAVHRLGARAVTLQIPGSALGIMFGKDADLRIATITIGDVVRRTSASSGGAGGSENDSGTNTYHAVFHLPPAPRTLLACQPPYTYDQALVGREYELQLLTAQLAPTMSAAPPPVLLTGASGIGKSALVTAFVNQQRHAFPGGIFWINMSQPDEIPLQIASCGGPGGLNLPGWASQSLTAQIEAVYNAWQQPIPRLLILEDLSDASLLARWAPASGGCRVLGTALSWPEPHQTLSLGSLPRAASLQLLLDRRARATNTTVAVLLSDRAQAQVANAICDEFDDLPLPLMLAGAVLGNHAQHVPLSSYLGRMAQLMRTYKVALNDLRVKAPSNEERKVSGAYLVTIDVIRAQGEVGSVALDLLRRIALCGAAPLPGYLLPRLVEVTPESGAAWDNTTKALRLLQQLGLLSAHGEFVRMHSAVAHLTRGILPASNEDIAAVERGLIASATSRHSQQEPWDGLPLVPHMAHICNGLGNRTDDQAATLLLNFGYLLQNLDDLQRARPAYERALEICTSVLGDSHPAAARILSNLGRLLQDQQDFEGALAYFKRALAINEQSSGPNSPPTARALHRIGSLYEGQGQLDEARSYYERELAINERIYGTEHPDTASSMLTLGHIFQEQGDYSQARNLYERALEVCELVLGQDHPATARSLHALGLLCEQQNDTWSARHYYERALAIRERTLGPQHPETAKSLHTLGYLLHLQDEFEKAHEYYERALAIREKVLGPLHPDTASTLNNIGHLMELNDDLIAAHHMYERAYQICSQTLGNDHPNTQVVRTNLNDVEARLRERRS